jgi:hypothetical protein
MVRGASRPSTPVARPSPAPVDAEPGTRRHPAAPRNPLGGSVRHPGTQRISTQHPGTRWAAAPRNPALIGTPEPGSTRQHPGTYCTRWVLGARWVADPVIRWVQFDVM